MNKPKCTHKSGSWVAFHCGVLEHRTDGALAYRRELFCDVSACGLVGGRDPAPRVVLGVEVNPATVTAQLLVGGKGPLSQHCNHFMGNHGMCLSELLRRVCVDRMAFSISVGLNAELNIVVLY